MDKETMAQKKPKPKRRKVCPDNWGVLEDIFERRFIKKSKLVQQGKGTKRL